MKFAARDAFRNTLLHQINDNVVCKKFCIYSLWKSNVQDICVKRVGQLSPPALISAVCKIKEILQVHD